MGNFLGAAYSIDGWPKRGVPPCLACQPRPAWVSLGDGGRAVADLHGDAAGVDEVKQSGAGGRTHSIIHIVHTQFRKCLNVNRLA